jgi:hypothetical protein
MRKVIFGLSGILVVAFIAIMVVNAQGNTKEIKKGPATTEVVKECGKCPSATASVAPCGMMADSKTAESKVCDPSKCKQMGGDPAKCKEMGCDPAKCKESKCDPATCKAVAKK